MSILNALAERFAKSTVESVVDVATDRAIKALFRHKAYPFIAGGQLHLMQHGVEAWRAWEMARQALADHLKDNTIKLGAEGWDWTYAGGKEVTAEYWADR